MKIGQLDFDAQLEKWENIESLLVKNFQSESTLPPILLIPPATSVWFKV